MDDLIEVLAEGGYTVTFEPSLKDDLPIVLATVSRGEAFYLASSPNSWKALLKAVALLPLAEEIFDAII